MASCDGVDAGDGQQGGVGVLGLARLERVGDPLERGGEAVQHRLGALAHQPRRVDGEHQRRHDQRDPGADERVVEARELEAAAARRLQRGDEHRRDAGLRGQQHAAADDRGAQHREARDDRDLPGAGPDDRDEQVPDRDPERHADGDLDRPPAPLADGQAEGDDGRDGREERLLVADELLRDQPRQRRRHRRLQDRPRRLEDPVAPRAQAGARRLGRLLEQLVAGGDALARRREAAASGASCSRGVPVRQAF